MTKLVKNDENVKNDRKFQNFKNFVNFKNFKFQKTVKSHFFRSRMTHIFRA